MNLRNAKITGLVGLSVTIIFTLNITGITGFTKHFIPPILIIGLISFITGLFINSTKVLAPILVGATVAIACAITYLMIAVSNI